MLRESYLYLPDSSPYMYLPFGEKNGIHIIAILCARSLESAAERKKSISYFLLSSYISDIMINPIPYDFYERASVDTLTG